MAWRPPPYREVPRTFTTYSRRFGMETTGEGFSTSWNIKMGRPIGSLFRGPDFLQAVRDAHVEMTVQVRNKAVEVLRRRVAANGRPQLSASPRPGREPERLKRSIMDDRNTFVSNSGFTVGRTDWLDMSPARLYWRQIEEGAPGYIARGLFFTPEGEAERPIPGSKSAIMFAQFRRGIATHIGPTPAYEYLNEATDWFFQTDLWLETYRRVLGSRGFDLEFRMAPGKLKND